MTYGLVGYFGGQAAANVLAEVGIIGLAVLADRAAGLIYLFIKRRERRSLERRSDQRLAG